MDILLRERDHIKILFRSGAFSFIDKNRVIIPYTSGMIGPYYVNSENVMGNRDYYTMVIRDISMMVKEALGFRKSLDYVVSGGERRDWFFSAPVSVRLKKPHLAICKNGETMGANIKGRKVVHVADLNNEGSSLRDLWIPKIRGLGGQIKNIFFYVDRDEKGVQVTEELGLKSNSLVKLEDDRWIFMRAQGLINDEEYSAVMEYKANPYGWAMKTLNSNEGIMQLMSMLNGKDGEKREKAERVMDFYGLSSNQFKNRG